jgi:hypothetical protein
MAINPQKLLPSSSAIVKVGKIKTNKRTENNSTDSLGEIKKELEKIKENLKKIHNLVLFNNKLIEKDLKLKRLTAERLKFAKKEKRLEEKNPEKKDKKDDKSIPKLGFFDRINRFIMFTLLGWVGVRLVKYLPKLIEFTKNIGPVMEFFSSFTANIFTGIVDFIDWGYKAHDNFREFIGELGGEPFQKAFDDFSSNLNKFVNLAIIAGIAASGGTDFGLGKKPVKPGIGSGGGSSQKLTIQERVKNSRIRGIQRKYGPSARKIYENALNNGKTPQQAEAAVRKGIKKGVSIRPGADSLSAKTAKKGSVLSRGVGKSVNRLSTKVLGKAGKKLVGKAFGRIPIIGGLVSFIISVVSGEDPGRAAAKAVGSTIGAGLGTFIPIPFAGTILGGILGDIVGGALYDTLIGNKQKEPEVVAKRRGGQVPTRGGKRRGRGASATRGGKQVGGAIKRQVRRVLEPPKATPISPGRSVGGKEKIQEMFPEAEDDNTMNPYGHLTETSKMMTDTNWLGPVFNLFAKTQAGDLPSQTDYKRVGTSINGWVNAAIAAGGGSSSGYSNGGVVNNSGVGDISKWLEKSAEELFQSKAQQAIRDLRKNLTLEPLTGDYDEGGDGGGGGGGFGGGEGSGTPGEWGPILDIIKKAEMGAGGYESMNPSTRLPGATNMTIGEVSRRASGAVGAYQFLPDTTLLNAMRGAGLKETDLFSRENQDKMAVWLITKARKVSHQMIKDNPDEAMIRLGMEWAGLPMPKNMRGHRRPVNAGQSYYAGDGRNAATVKVNEMRDAFAKLGGVSSGSSTASGGSGSPSSGRIAEERGTGGDGKSRPRQGSTAGGGGSSGGVIYKGMKTGPSGYIGGSAAYHIDTKFHRSLGMGTMVSAMDKLANAYSARGREMVFSNSGVRLQVWNPSAPSRDKSTLLQRAIDAHSHSTFMRSEGFLPFDYYIPFKSANRDLYHKSTEGAEILLPTFGGNVSVGTKYGGYGRSAEIFNGSGKMVAMTGHGDTRYGEGDSGESVDSGESGEGGKGSKSSGGMWGFSGFGGWGFSGFGGWGFSGFGGSSKKSRKGKGSDSEDSDLSGLSGKDKKIYLHWNAAPYTNPIGPYHTVFLGDGKKVQHADYNTHRNHTDGRNTNAIGLAIAAMHEGSPTNWKNAPTSAQINAMVSEAANIAKSMGWNASDINKSNIMTHAEAAFLDGYGLGSGDSQTRWDLITLRGSDATSGNLKKPGSKGGNELRGMIRQKMKYGGPVGGKENTRNSLNYKPPYESHQQTQVVLVPIETVVQVPGSDNKAISFGGVNSIIDPTKYSFSYTG